MRRAFRWSIPFLLAAILAGGCATRPPVVDPSLVRRSERVPVVLIPGMTGTELIDIDSGRPVWGDGKRLLFPRDGGMSTALPLDGGAVRAGAGGVIRTIRLLGGSVRLDVYGPVIETMRANGYRPGDLDHPRPDDTFFVFPYDWRESAVDVAARLRERLERVRLARGEDVLTVHLMCQSNAAQVARYLVKYGGESLERAEAGVARPPPARLGAKMILVGTANGGALRVLREMNRGRRYIAIVGRRMRPEVFFTYPSLYEALPGYRDDLFLDEDGEPLDIDLFDPDAWRTYGWSIFSADAMRRATREGARATFGDRTAIDRHLERALDRARRLQAVLLRDPPGFRPPRIYSIQNVYAETAERAVIACSADGHCRTRFGGDRALRRDAVLHPRTVSPGDGHASWFSQVALSPGELAAFADEPAFVDDRHFEMILNPEAQRRWLRFLAD